MEVVMGTVSTDEEDDGRRGMGDAGLQGIDADARVGAVGEACNVICPVFTVVS
jgi:hypothetical protein